MGVVALEERRGTEGGTAAAAALLGDGCHQSEALDGRKGANSAASTVIAEPSKCWPKLLPLEGVKSKKRTILRLQRLGLEGATDVGSLNLTGRAVLHGLTAEEATDLACELAGGTPLNEESAEKSTGRQWSVEHHDSLKVVVLSQTDEDPRSVAAGGMPHVLVVPVGSVEPGSAACAALAVFPGALLVVAQELTQDLDELLAELGISELWSCAALSNSAEILSCQPLAPIQLEEPAADVLQGPTFLHDVKVPGPASPQSGSQPWMEELLEEQLAPLYMDEFAADLGNLRQSQEGYGIKLSLMVQQGAAKEVPELLGFLAYKTWGAPLPSVSVCAVGVPSKFRGCGYGRRLMAVAEAEAARLGEPGAPGLVRFRSLATAVGFYTRLGYIRTDEEEEPVPAQGAGDSDDEDAPCVPMERACEPEGASSLKGCHSPLQAWSPRRSLHLEDGPTWLPAEAFLLPEAAL